MAQELRPYVLQIHFTRKEREQLEKLAAYERRTMAGLVRWLVARYAAETGTQ